MYFLKKIVDLFLKLYYIIYKDKKYLSTNFLLIISKNKIFIKNI